jgi:hypothetical protein
VTNAKDETIHNGWAARHLAQRLEVVAGIDAASPPEVIIASSSSGFLRNHWLENEESADDKNSKEKIRRGL